MTESNQTPTHPIPSLTSGVHHYTPPLDLEDNLKYVHLDTVGKCPLGIGLIPKYLQNYAEHQFEDLFRLHPLTKANVVNYENTNIQTGQHEIDHTRPHYATRWSKSYNANIPVIDDDHPVQEDSFWGLYNTTTQISSLPPCPTTFDLPYQFQPFETYVKQNFSDVQSKFRQDKKGWREYNQVVINWFQDGNDYIPLQTESTKGSKHKSIVTIFISEAYVEDESRIIRFVPIPPGPTSLITSIDIVARHGTVITMGGKMQETFFHADLKTPHRFIARAISITFKSKPSDSNS